MKFTFLGTAAAEGFPAVFCNCKYCVEARRLKGKNIRTRSQSLINDDLLIDLPADTYSHFLQNGIEGDKIKYLLITHSHSDHFYFDELRMRNGAFAHDMRVENLEVFCGEGTYNKIIENGVPEKLTITKVPIFEKISLGYYSVTALPARHMDGDGALIYIIEGDKTILYAHDTGYFYNKVYDYIKNNRIHFDMVTLDCTNIDITISDEGSHMGIENIERVLENLKLYGVVDYETKVYINHFSHNGNPLHHILEERVKNMDITVSFDGCCVEL